MRRSSVVEPAPGGPAIATREPRPNGVSLSSSGAPSRARAKTGVRSAKNGRSAGGSAGPPFTASTRTSEG